MTGLKIGGNVRITEHNNREYIGKTGILLSVQKIHPAIEGREIKERLCKVKLDNKIVDCLLSQLAEG